MMYGLKVTTVCTNAVLGVGFLCFSHALWLRTLDDRRSRPPVRGSSYSAWARTRISQLDFVMTPKPNEQSNAGICLHQPDFAAT